MNQQCKEANDFAMSLLMPKDSFHQVVEELNGNVGDIAMRFQVPSAAVRHRAAQLGYEGHNLRDSELKKVWKR